MALDNEIKDNTWVEFIHPNTREKNCCSLFNTKKDKSLKPIPNNPVIGLKQDKFLLNANRKMISFCKKS